MNQSLSPIDKFAHRLLHDPDERTQFIAALTQPRAFPPTILWCQPRPEVLPFEVLPPLSWQPVFVDRLLNTFRPGQHPLHQQGHFYCLDFSSVFAGTVLTAIAAPVTRVVDVCASPGGKSLLAWMLLRPRELVCNETIGKRIPALVSNLKRCRVEPALVLKLDPAILAQQLTAAAEVVIVDAPCTGQSLLAKGEKSPGCFHPVTINKNANRQKRIIAHSAAIVQPGGYLAYMTCAYSPEENEAVCQWFLQRFPQFQPVTVPSLASFQSQRVDFPCYRLFPHHGLGAGAFTALLQFLP